MHEESIEIWRELGDKKSLVGALNALGQVYFSEGKFKKACSAF